MVVGSNPALADGNYHILEEWGCSLLILVMYLPRTRQHSTSCYWLLVLRWSSYISGFASCILLGEPRSADKWYGASYWG